jgi:hypothetical protein
MWHNFQEIERVNKVLQEAKQDHDYEVKEYANRIEQLEADCSKASELASQYKSRREDLVCSDALLLDVTCSSSAVWHAIQSDTLYMSSCCAEAYQSGRNCH